MEDLDILNKYSDTRCLDEDFHSNVGLANGKMRAAIFFFHCVSRSGDEFYEEVGGHLLDELCNQLSTSTSLSFADGLCGIGWGMEYLIQHGFVEGDADEVLIEIDSYVIDEIYRQSMTEVGERHGIVGLGRYILMRIRPSWQNGDTYKSLELKENLIYLIDWLDRKLHVAGDVAGELRDWLLDLRKTGFYQTKVNKMLERIEELYGEC